VRNTAEIGLFKVLSETSSAANVRRIEAVTGPAAVTLMRRHDASIGEAAELLRVPPERVPDAVSSLRSRVRELERAAREGSARAGVDLDQLASQVVEADGARVLAAAVESADGKALLDLADRLKGRLGDAAIVLGSAAEDRVDLIAMVAPALVARGVRADEVIRAAAAVVGGGGGGRETLARAGGRDPSRRPVALSAARAAIENALAG
jgi:alanyl-tRNA synthetase